MNLQWTPTKLRAYKDISTQIERYKYGGSCAYLKVGKTWAVKLYQDTENRDFSFFNQRRASTYNLAPKVGNRFRIRHPNCQPLNPFWREDRKIIYGFTTQVVTIRRSSKKQVKALKEALNEINIYIGDLAIDNNVGYLDKNLLCIDFDYWSLEAEYLENRIV